MAPTLISGGGTAFSSSGGTATANPTLLKPAGLQVGQFMVASFTTNGGAVTDNTGTWTKRAEVTLTNPKGYLFTKVADAADVAVADGGMLPGSWTIAGTVGSSSGGCSAWAGVDLADPLAGVAAVYQNATTSTTSFPVPFTTDEDDAMVVGVWVANTGELAHTIPAGTTELYTLGSKHNTLVYATKAAAGSATWTYVLSSGRAGGGMVIALKPSGSTEPPPAPTPTCDYRMVSADGAVRTKTTSAVSVRLKLGTDQAVTAGVQWTAPATPNALGVVQIPTPDSAVDWYYRVAMTDGDGNETLDSKATVGRVPTVTGPNVTACFSSCFNSAHGSDSAVWPAMAATSDAWYFMRGDEWYKDNGPTTLQAYRDAFLEDLTRPSSEAVYATKRTVLAPSDHDFSMDNNGNGATHPTASANYNQAYREFIATPTLPAAGFYYSYAIPSSRVLLVNLDHRTFASDPLATDNSSKTLLGSTQKQWLKDPIAATDRTDIWLLGDTAWIGAADAGDDSWMGYATERTELGNFFLTHQGKRFRYFGGDMHALAVGTNGVGGVINYQAAPIQNNASQKGGPWNGGVYPSTGTTVVEQYARIALVEGSGEYVTTYTGLSAPSTVRITHADTVQTSQALTGTVDDSLQVTDVASVVMDRPRLVDDTATGSDVATATADRVRTLADSAALSDTSAHVADRARSTADQVSGSDVVAVGSDRPRVLTDSAAITDLMASGRATVQADTVAGSDAMTVGRSADRITADSLTVSDAITIERATPLGDSVSGSDLVAATSARVTSLADESGVTDTVSTAGAQIGSVSDTAHATDELTASFVRDRSVGDAIAIGDSAASSADRSGALVDLIAVGDSTATLADRSAGLADAVQATDALSTNRAGQQETPLADAAQASDALGLAAERVRQSADAIAISDALIVDRAGVANVDLGDTATATDLIAGTIDRGRFAADSLTVTDALTVERTSGSGSAVADPLTVLDEIEATWVRAAVLEDDLAAVDAATVGVNRTTLIGDTLTVADVLALFNGPTRDLDLTLSLMPGRYYSHVSRDRYEARVP